MSAAIFDSYLSEQRSKGRSEYTIEKARWAWKKFRDTVTVDLPELTEQDILSWHTAMFASGLGRNTVATHARVMRHFLYWAKFRGFVSCVIPAAPTPAKPNRRTLTPNQLQAFTAALEGGRNRLRNRAIFLTFLATGLRLGELGRLHLSDIDLASGLVSIRAETSKSKTGRRVPLGAVASQAVKDYLLWGRQGSTNQNLFLSEDGGSLGLRGIHLILHRAARRAGVAWASPHTLRHTFATRSLLNGRDAFQVKALLGHESIRSTEIYMDMAEVERALQGTSTPADSLFGPSRRPHSGGF